MLRVLGIDPNSKGLGFAVLENNDKLVDWGIKYLARRKTLSSAGAVSPKLQVEQYLRLMGFLIDFYRPDVIVFEDSNAKDSRRGKRTKGLLNRITAVAEKKNIPSYSYSGRSVKAVFSQYEAKTKHDIAEFLSGQFPELICVLPRKRKAWMSEDVWMNMFTALALSICYSERKVL